MVESSVGLKRSLTFVDTIALGINGVIGSGIFLLPALVAATLGPAAILPTLCAGFLCFLIALCFAEVGRHFSDTGGAYLYARATLGRFVGFEVGWMSACSAIASWAALVNAFPLALAKVIPVFGEPVAHKLAMLVLLIVLAAVNYRGAKQGALLSNAFSVAKILPIVVFVVVGMFFFSSERFVPFAPHGFGGIGEGVLVIFYAYVGFEALPVPAGEMKNPQRAVPLALISVLLFVTIVYVAVQAVATGTLENVADHANPVASAAESFMGPAGGLLMGIGIVLSIVGVNTSMAVIVPRYLFALGERGQMPRALAHIHPQHRTPTTALLVATVIVGVLATSGSFKDLAIIAVMSRFAQYLATCAAIFVLHGRPESTATTTERAGFRLPYPRTVAGVAIVLSLILLSQADLQQILVGAGVAALGGLVYVWRERTFLRRQQARLSHGGADRA